MRNLGESAPLIGAVEAELEGISRMPVDSSAVVSVEVLTRARMRAEHLGVESMIGLLEGYKNTARMG